jgi:hypothetical protein
MRSITPTLGALAAGALLAGCATTVPNIRERGEKPWSEVPREANLVAHIKCELARALTRVEMEDLDNKLHGASPALRGYSTAWLNDWGAKANLKVVVEEASTFAPSLTVTDTLSNHVSKFSKGGDVTFGRVFSMPLAVTGTTKATRTENIGFYFNFADLKADTEVGWPAGAQQSGGDDPARFEALKTHGGKACPASDGVMMEGDLKIYEFIRSKVQVSRVPGVIVRKDGASPFDVFTYDIQFAVTRSGSFAPSWKLYPVSINTSTPLLAGSRTKTNSLVLTLGKREGEKPSQAAEDAHLAQLIGKEVASAIRDPVR